MRPDEAAAARVRRLSAELRADHDALRERTAEVERFSAPDPEHREERPIALALTLDRAYTTLESMLERVARALEGGVPAGDDWHRALLRNAGLDVPHVRPPILGQPALEAADELRRFRHFVRHAYTARIDAARVQAVARGWLEASTVLGGDLDAFAGFLEKLAERLEAGAH